MKTTSIILVTFIVCLSTSFSAQLSAVGFKDKRFDQFLKSKTYVVKTGNEKFDETTLKAINENWDITEVEFIGDEEFKNKILDESASFVMLLEIAKTKTDVTNSQYTQSYHYLALMNGGRKKLNKYSYDDMLAYCPVNFYQNENEMTNCSYRVENMIQSMDKAIKLIKEKKISGGSLSMVKKLQSTYNAKSANIKKRTLLVNSDAIGMKLDKDKFKKLYPYEFEFCNTDKIEQVIKDKSTEYYYLQPAVTLNRSIIVFDPSNGDVLYFGLAISGLHVSDKDIKTMVKEMN